MVTREDRRREILAGWEPTLDPELFEYDPEETWQSVLFCVALLCAVVVVLGLMLVLPGR